jgi:hypothetical protein
LLSTVRLRSVIYGLPGETLLQFEGSGYTTDWELSFPPAANPRGMRTLADVLLTIDMNAEYAQDLAATRLAVPAVPVSRAVVLAAGTWDPKGLATLRGPGPRARISFEVIRLALPAQEKNRRLSNLCIICVGNTTKNYSAHLTASAAGIAVDFPIEKGLALSNGGALLGGGAPLPLNALVGTTLDQAFVLEIDNAGVADELSQLLDVVVYLEYGATV